MAEIRGYFEPFPRGMSYEDFANYYRSQIPKNMFAPNYGDITSDATIRTAYGQYNKQAMGTPKGGSFYNTPLPDPTPYFDAAGLNRLFDTARGNLGQQQASTAANAARRAGTLASGFLNPAGFVNMAATQATAPYAQQFGRLELGRAQGLQGLQQLLYQMLAQRALAERGGEDAQRNYLLQLQQLAEQRRQFDAQLEQNEAGFLDYLGMFLNPLAYLGGAAINKWG